MTVSSDELAPCPFCGTDPTLYTVCDGDGAELEFLFRCDECGVEQGADWKHNAIAAWNRRSPRPSSDTIGGELADEQMDRQWCEGMKTAATILDSCVDITTWPSRSQEKYRAALMDIQHRVSLAQEAIIEHRKSRKLSSLQAPQYTGEPVSKAQERRDWRASPPEGRQDGGVTVKRLEWDMTEENWHTATTPFNFGYEVRVTDRGAVRWRCGSRPFETFEGTLSEAKAACQADFETRIRSALTHSTPVEAQTVEAWAHFHEGELLSITLRKETADAYRRAGLDVRQLAAQPPETMEPDTYTGGNLNGVTEGEK
jgi:hypothetical protein